MMHLWKYGGCILFVSLMTACGKDEQAEDIAGKGGNAVLRIMPLHHTTPIDSGIIYIKYNAQDAPLTYDDSTTIYLEGSVPVAYFTGLRKGKYYLYGSGWDPYIGDTVVGGAPYIIAEEDTNSLNLYITEGD